MAALPSLKIHCRYDKLISVDKFIPHPKNRNEHPPEQIKRLAKILKYQGVRAPIVVSKQSGFIVKGHGTLLAIKQCGETKAPVVYQNFATPRKEYLFVQSDNAIAVWAELDLSGIQADIKELGKDFDLDLLGLMGEEPIAEPPEKEDPKDKDFETMKCPNCGVLLEKNG